MHQPQIKTYRRRWLVLAAFMLVTLVNQGCWITFAPITGTAAGFYGTSELMIGLLSMVFMIVYVLIVIPSAWIIDARGFRLAVSVGAALTAVSALARGLFAASFPAVFAAQVGIALGQPVVLGSITKLAARWFPEGERATAAGFGTLAIYLGILAAMLATPGLTARWGLPGMLVIYGLAAAAAAILFLAVAREHPPTPAGPPGEEERALMFDGLKAMLGNRSFLLLMTIFFIGLGMFNGITTWIEAILRPRGLSIAQAGTVGGLMLVGGIAGAAIVPVVSDALGRRVPFIILALAGLLPGLAGLTFATGYGLLLASGFAFGFFLLSAGPIGFQYGAEIARPGPEGTSNSLLLVMGQISGIVFIFGMEMLKQPSGAMTRSLVVLLGLTGLALVLACLLQESRPQRAQKRP